MDREMTKVRWLVGCLMPSVTVEIRDCLNTKVKLSGPAGILLEEDKIPGEWEIRKVLTRASGKFGTVKIYAKINGL